MAGPPKDKHPSVLWQKLLERPLPSVVVPYPVRKGEQSPGNVRIRLLSESEMMRVRANSELTAKEMLQGKSAVGDLGYEEIYRNESIIELLAIACRDVDMPELPVFPSAMHARAQLITDQFAVLATLYNELRRTAGPIVSDMTDEEMEAWIKVLTEGAEVGPLAFAQLSSEAKTDLILRLAARLRTSPTGNGSAGSPPDGSSLTSSAERQESSSALLSDSERSMST